jgi:site-specific recombinase XerD
LTTKRDKDDMEKITQQTYLFLSQEHYLEISVLAFLRDRKASELAKGTIAYYKEKLDKFVRFCDTQEIKYVAQINAETIREYMLYMSEVRHNNRGNIHSFYRCVRAFLYWYENEYEPEGWTNPIKKVKAPKQSQEIIQPVSLETLNALLDTCEAGTFICTLRTHS